MNIAKKLKKEIQLVESKEEVAQISEESDALSQKLRDLMSFDSYFRKLMSRDSAILIHHKAPMRQYAESKGLKDIASEDEFDKVFEQY